MRDKVSVREMEWVESEGGRARWSASTARQSPRESIVATHPEQMVVSASGECPPLPRSTALKDERSCGSGGAALKNRKRRRASPPSTTVSSNRSCSFHSSTYDMTVSGRAASSEARQPLHDTFRFSVGVVATTRAVHSLCVAHTCALASADRRTPVGSSGSSAECTPPAGGHSVSLLP